MFALRLYRNAARKLFICPRCPSSTFNSALFSSETDLKGHKSPATSTNFLNTRPTESEKEFLVQAKLDPDHFGPPIIENLIEDEGDMLEERHISEKPPAHKRLSTQKYADIIKEFIRQRRIKEAIDVVEVRMLQEDRVKPENYIYNLLLGACGRVGYTKKAFMLYNDMKKRGLKVTGGTYTALFNACANSPWALTDGLARARHLYSIMIEKRDEPNDTTYNAMIKAFGRCGDLPMAFSLVDGMAKKGFRIQDDTINFLLQACISDKETGFRHSLLVWRKMVEKGIRPSIYTFNLLLRCVRDCGLGDLDATNDVINQLVDESSPQESLASPDILQIGTNNENKSDQIENNTYKVDLIEPQEEQNILINQQVQNFKETQHRPNLMTDIRPNLLADKPHLGNTLLISEVKKPEDRLLLVGGQKGFLDTMLRHNCTPDIKTFTQLLDCIPSTKVAEKELINAMKKLNVAEDVDFFNMLIKKKSMRCHYDDAKEVLDSMKQQKMRPNLVTFGVLALGCRTKEEANDLLEEMRRSRYTINAAILGAMLHQACYQKAFHYIFEIMEICLRESIPVNKKFLDRLEGFKEHCKALLDAKELNKKEVKLFGVFKARHKTWLTEVQIDETEGAHPWQQFRQTYPNDVLNIPKDTARFKPRHTSRFKVKTSQKHRNNRR